ncbi:hypothetical protein TMRH483_01268 [Qipengyuania sp. 483]
MQMSKLVFWSLLVVAMAALGAAGFNGSYFDSRYYAARHLPQDNEELTGYWYRKEDNGCFDSGQVYELGAAQATVIRSGQIEKSDMSFSNSASGPYFYLIPEEGKEYRFFYENTGKTLDVKRIDVIEGDETISAEDSFTAYTRCEYPTTLGVILSLFFRVFDPSSVAQTALR